MTSASSAQGRSRTDRFLVAVLARDTVRDIANVLAESDIVLMPIKGVLLQQTIYDDPTDRDTSDIDLLVRPRSFHRACRALGRAGHEVRRRGSNDTQQCFVAPRSRLVVDLHHRLFPILAFSLETEAVMARGTVDRDAFGAPVLVPEPYDLYCHLLGKLATDHLDDRMPHRLLDPARVAARHRLEPQLAARRLDEAGMGRAARFAISLLGDDPFAQTVRRHLRPDPIGDLCAHCSTAVITKTGSRSIPAGFAARLLSRSLPAAVGGVVLGGYRRTRYRRGTSRGLVR